MIELLLAFLFHFIADFLLQSREMGQKKSTSLKWLGHHVLIIFVCFLPFGFKFALANALVHAVIDGTIWKGYKWFVFKRYFNSIKDQYDKQTKINITYSYLEDWKAEKGYAEDSAFYTTIGLDQFLHGATIISLMEYL